MFFINTLFNGLLSDLEARPSAYAGMTKGKGIHSLWRRNKYDFFEK